MSAVITGRCGRMRLRGITIWGAIRRAIPLPGDRLAEPPAISLLGIRVGALPIRKTLLGFGVTLFSRRPAFINPIWLHSLRL